MKTTNLTFDNVSKFAQSLGLNLERGSLGYELHLANKDGVKHFFTCKELSEVVDYLNKKAETPQLFSFKE